MSDQYPTTKVEGYPNGIFLNAAGPGGICDGRLISFPIVASVGAGEAGSSVQATVLIPFPHRFRGVAGYCATKTAGDGSVDPTFDVKNSGGTSVLTAAKTLAANATIYQAVVAAADNPTTRAAGVYTLRATTGASTGAITGLLVTLDIEKVPDL